MPLGKVAVATLHQPENCESRRIASRGTSGFIEELETGPKERTEKLTYLREALERYSSLAEVEVGKAKAMVKQLELSINRRKATEGWLSL